MQIFNFLNGALVLLTGIYYWLTLPQVSDHCGACIGYVLAGAYSIMNGIIYLLVSMNCVGPLDRMNRRWCGFVYTATGRFFFIVFAGSMCFALKDPAAKTSDGYKMHPLGVVAGSLSWANAFFNVWAICNYPEYTDNRGGIDNASRSGGKSFGNSGTGEAATSGAAAQSPPPHGNADINAPSWHVDEQENPFA